MTNIRLSCNSSFEIAATIEAPGLVRTRSFLAFYRFPSKFASFGQILADPFVAALLSTSMKLAEPLIIDAPVSSRLLNAVPGIMEFYHHLDPMLQMIEVKASATREFTEAATPSSNAALFFTCGVDSFYSLTKLTANAARYNLSHLLFVQGFDIRLSDTSLFERTRNAAEEVARHYKKDLIVVTTNIREVTDQYLSWPNCCGGALASVALALGGFFGIVYFASDLGPNEAAPLAIHPDLDPLWSTETTTFVHHSYGTSRVEKAAALVDNTLAQRHLRVCWKNTGGAYNCGRCSKCVRTMIALHLAGALSKFSFSTTLTPKLIERIDYTLDTLDSSVTIHTKQIISELRSRGEVQFADSLSRAITKSYPRRRFEALKGWALKQM